MLPDIKTILYATDLGDYGPRVFRYAVSLSERYQARIVLLHAIEPLGPTAQTLVRSVVPEGTLESVQLEGFERVRAQIHDRLVEFWNKERGFTEKKSDDAVEVQVTQGHPARVILETARAVDADLIVIGTHGYSGVTRVLLGSVANKVVQQSPVPVLIVPVQDS